MEKVAVKFKDLNKNLYMKSADTCKSKTSIIGLDNNCLSYYSFMEIFEFVEKHSEDRYEFGGIYNAKRGFIIDPNVAHFDKESERPFTTLDMTAKSCVIFHSHPFNEENCAPSIEDLDCVRLNPHLVFLIIVKNGIFVISAMNNHISIDKVYKLYKYMNGGDSDEWDYEQLAEAFQSNEIFNSESIKEFDIYIHFIDTNTVKFALNRSIYDSYRYKDRNIRSESIVQYLQESIRNTN